MDIFDTVTMQAETLADMHGWHDTPDVDLVGSEDGHLVLISRAEARLRSLVRKARGANAAEHEDLQQAAMAGYLDALTRFDAERGTEPYTYAQTTIINALTEANRSASPKPAQWSEHARFWRAMDATKSADEYSPVDAREWSDMQRWTGWELQEAKDAGNPIAEGILDSRISRWERKGWDVPVKMGETGRGLEPHIFDQVHATLMYTSVDKVVTDADGEAGTLHDVVTDEGTQAAYAEAEDRVAVKQLLSHLDEREGGIVAALFGLNGRPERKAQEVADEHGVSRSRVLNIRKAALGKLAKVAA